VSLKDEKQRRETPTSAMLSAVAGDRRARTVPADSKTRRRFPQSFTISVSLHVFGVSYLPRVSQRNASLYSLAALPYPRQSSCICWRSQGEKRVPRHRTVGFWEIAVDYICDKSLFRVVLALPTFRVFICLHLTHGLTVIQASSLICR
jgi:hypothetical protein